MMPSDWDRLFDAFSSGNDKDLHDLFQKLGEYLLRVAYKCVESKPELAPDTHDCVQEALLAIWQAIVKRSGPQNRRATRSWCKQIVTHKMLDLLRRHGYPIKPTAASDPKPGGKFVELDENVASLVDVGTDIQRQVDNSEALRIIFTYPKLTADERIILWFSFIEPMDDSAIAAYLNIAQATVRVKRMRALQKLRDDPALFDWLRSLL